ncbi:MAG: hypothetical protein PUA84_00490 [Oscillospiraceae bacterium]|nr:hypothetical protein [Oscillospiraceae bacterium]
MNNIFSKTEILKRDAVMDALKIGKSKILSLLHDLFGLEIFV